MKEKYLNKGFTLIELMVVIALLGLLSAIGAVKYGKINENIRINKAKSEMKMLRLALLQLASDMDRWPIACQAGLGVADGSDTKWWIKVLVEGYDVTGLGNFTPKNMVTDNGWNWKGPYIDKVPQDPWGHRYLFHEFYNQSTVSAIICLGPNGVADGSAYDSSWCNCGGSWATWSEKVKAAHPPDEEGFAIVPKHPLGDSDDETDFRIYLWME